MTESTLTEDSPESAETAAADPSETPVAAEPAGGEVAPPEPETAATAATGDDELAEPVATDEAAAAASDGEEGDDEPAEPVATAETVTAETASDGEEGDDEPAEAVATNETAAAEAAGGDAAGDPEPATEDKMGEETGDKKSAAPIAPVAKAAAAKKSAGAPSKQTEGLWAAMQEKRPVKGKVIGWNKGGFHVVVDKITAFCPHSEMELGKPAPPQDHLDKTYDFAVLEIHDGGRRIVLSRTMMLRGERSAQRRQTVGKLEPGAVVVGRVASITDFGAFVELGGVQGLVHVSELKRSRVDHPSDVVELGQEVEVQVLKVDKGGKRISLSMSALEPDPWEGVGKRFVEGSVVRGTVEKVAPFGAFVVLEPGLSGLLPSSAINLPHGASLGRIYPPGKEISVEIRRVDPRRRRISLALEGSQSEGSRADFERYVQGAEESSSGGFNALAAALEKIKGS